MGRYANFLARWKRIRLWVWLGLVALFAPGCANRLFFYPDRLLHHHPEQLGLAQAREVRFASHDGTPLHGWFCPARGEAKGTVIHLHGNAQNLTAHAAFVAWLPEAGYHLFVWDYRGYGQSGGRAERRGILRDAEAAFAFVRTLPEVDETNLYVIGQSLGGATAVSLLGRTAQPGVRAVVIDSAFASYRRIAREKIAEMPLLSWLRVPLAWLLVGDHLSPLPVAHRLAGTPVVFLHGDRDGVIPWEHSRDLRAAVGPSAEFWMVPGGAHTEAFYHPEYQRRVLDFFARARAPVAPPPSGPKP
jgi:fermentation-respiration switch protein FrsA (DUF1100 family)